MGARGGPTTPKWMARPPQACPFFFFFLLLFIFIFYFLNKFIYLFFNKFIFFLLRWTRVANKMATRVADV
jgi:hypothetical protein